MEFCRNTYRVLLTRARFETIIWIPAGDAADSTREPELFDQTATYLLACGAKTLTLEAAMPSAETARLL
jgi:hypothetical protein